MCGTDHEQQGKDECSDPVFPFPQSAEPGDPGQQPGGPGQQPGQQPEQQSVSQLGDVDGDGRIKAADARLALRASVGLETYAAGSREALACDADGDGQITAEDARLILRASVGLETLTA